MRTWLPSFGISIVLLMAPSSSGQVNSYTFTRIADNQGPLIPRGDSVLNNAGVVAFKASVPGGEGIFTGSGGPLTTIVLAPFPPDTGGLSQLGAPAINDAGLVAFAARVSFSTEPSRMFVGRGGALTTIAASGVGSAFNFAPSVNNLGTVAFSGHFPGDVTAVLTGSGGPLTAIATSVATSSFFTSPSINDAGTVAFQAHGSSLSGIFTGSGGPLTPILDGNGPLSSSSAPSINNAGMVAFSATNQTSGIETIFVASVGVLTPRADTTGAFFAFFNVAFNDAGSVAFKALLRDGRIGIFTGPDPVADKVIQEDDPLFGSTVAGSGSLVFFRNGLNNRGQIVFGAELANGTRGIFLATPAVDHTPPVISGMPLTNCRLWPPNHKLVQVATVAATDALSGIAPGSLELSATSNEPPDRKDPDIVITPNSSGGFVIQLRADRLGSGKGRIYTITATVADLAGNRAEATATCVVPHDQGK